MANAICRYCGQERDENEFYDRPRGLSDVCIECEEKLYDRLAEKVGAYIALFAACVSFDVPFWAERLPKVEDFLEIPDRWVYYNELIADEVHGENGLVRGFFDGETNILHIFGSTLSKTDVAKYIEVTQKHEQAKPGTREKRERWGIGDLCKGYPMTDELYDELDRSYENWVGRYRGQTITPQMDDSLTKIVRWNAVTERLIQCGDYVNAQKVQKMVDDLMASEQMRKKDEKPVEVMRMDALVNALENAGAMENGKFRTTDEVMRAFHDRFLSAKKYNYSIDAADHMIYDYYNTARINADLPTADVLPSDLELTDDFGEFAEGKTEEQKRRERFAGLTKVMFERTTDEGET